jgi:hypothetical protein
MAVARWELSFPERKAGEPSLPPVARKRGLEFDSQTQNLKVPRGQGCGEKGLLCGWQGGAAWSKAPLVGSL